MSTKIKINSQIFQDSNNVYYPKDESEVSDLIRELYKQDSPTEIIGSNSKSFIGKKRSQLILRLYLKSQVLSIIDLKNCILKLKPVHQSMKSSRS